MSSERGATPPTSRTLLQVLAWCAFGAAVLTNLWGLYAPSQPGPAMFPGFDKIAHLGSFALVMLTGLLAGIRPRLLATVLVVHAALSELVQHTLLPGRSGDLADLLADVAGVGLGWAVFLIIERGAARKRRVRPAVPAGTDPDR